MRNLKFFSCLLAALTIFAPFQNSNAQTEVTESGEKVCETPRDGIYAKSMGARLPLAYDHVEERDVMWEKRIWREIDVKELRNHHFANAKDPLINILLDAAVDGDVMAYSALNDEFKEQLSDQAVKQMRYQTDTVEIWNPETMMPELIAVENVLNPMDVKRYRVKEVWYFDSRTSQMNVRILGIAPIVNKYDDDGNFIASMPMCWFYFDELRPILAKKAMKNPNNDREQMSWDDVFVSRFFNSYITKQSNTRDLRLQDMYSGVDVLLESDKIEQGIFHFEHDLFSY